MRKKLDSLLLKPWSSDCPLQQPTRNLIESGITIFIYLLYIVSYCLWNTRSRRAGPLVHDTDTAGNNYKSDHQYLLHAWTCKSQVNLSVFIGSASAQALPASSLLLQEVDAINSSLGTPSLDLNIESKVFLAFSQCFEH